MFASQQISKKIPSSSCSTALVESFSKALQISPSTPLSLSRQHASFSTMSSNEREVVTFLGLNNLSDNPGAVKRVSS